MFLVRAEEFPGLDVRIMLFAGRQVPGRDHVGRPYSGQYRDCGHHEDEDKKPESQAPLSG